MYPIQILLNSIVTVPEILTTFIIVSIAGTTLPITAYSAFKDHNSWTKKILLPISLLFLIGFVCLLVVLIMKYLNYDGNFDVTTLFTLFFIFIISATVLLLVFILFAIKDVLNQKTTEARIKKQIFNENYFSVKFYLNERTEDNQDD